MEMFRNSTKVTSELGSDIIQFIVKQRADRKDEAIQTAIDCLKQNFSYSLVQDFIESDCRYDRGVIRGYYSLAYYLEIISDDDYEKLCHQLFEVFDADMIIESAVNKMKGNNNGK